VRAADCLREIDTPLFMVSRPELVMPLPENGICSSLPLNTRPLQGADGFKVVLAGTNVRRRRFGKWRINCVLFQKGLKNVYRHRKVCNSLDFC
jgi:hypothetical protein